MEYAPLVKMVREVNGNHIIPKYILFKEILMDVRDSFLQELKETWTPMVSKDIDIDKSMIEVMNTINKPRRKLLYKSMNITESDLRNLLTEIKAEKNK